MNDGINFQIKNLLVQAYDRCASAVDLMGGDPAISQAIRKMRDGIEFKPNKENPLVTEWKLMEVTRISK